MNKQYPYANKHQFPAIFLGISMGF